MRILCLLGVAACTTTGSPLSQLSTQIEIDVDPMHHVELTITTWNDLAILRDAMEAGEVTATIDGSPLPVDVATTATYAGGDRYVAAFASGPEASRGSSTPPHPESSRIEISDGTTTWTAEIGNMFSNDVEPTAPLRSGTDVFEWQSAASPSPYSTISWACVEVVGSSAACDGEAVDDPSIMIAQQYITATIAGAPGDRIEVTGERNAYRDSSGDGPMFIARMAAHFSGTLE
jgi:hypothetical protein